MANDLLTRLILEGADKATKELNDFGKAGDKAFKQLDDAGRKGAKGVEQLGAAVDKTGTAFNAIPGKVGQVGNAVVNAGTKLAALAESFNLVAVAALAITAVVVGVTAGLFSLAKSAADTTDKIRDASIAAGTAADKFSALGFAASQSGSDAESLARSLTVISDATGQAIDASKQSIGAFEKMSIKLTDAAGHARDTGDIFLNIADKISKMKRPADQAAAAADLLGRRVGPALVQTLREGRAGLQAFAKDAEHLGIVFSKTELAVGENFNDAVDRLNSALDGLHTKLGLAFAPAFTTLVNGLTNAIVFLRTALQPIADVIGSQLAAAFEFIGDVITNQVIPAFELIGDAVQLVVDGFNELFGTNITVAEVLGSTISAIIVTIVGLVAIIGVAVAAFAGLFALMSVVGVGVFVAIGLAVQKVIAFFSDLNTAAQNTASVFQPIIDFISALGESIRSLGASLLAVDFASFAEFATEAFDAVLEEVNSVIEQVVVAWNTVPSLIASALEPLVTATQQVWDTIKSIFADGIAALSTGWDTIKTAAQSAWETIENIVSGAITSIMSNIQPLINLMNDLWEVAKKAAAAIASVTGGGGGTPSGEGHAGGGLVRGAGTGTSDNIPAWLSDKEWVIRAAAVKKYGNSIFAALNSMRLPASAVRQLLGYAGGGPVNFDLGSLVNSPMRFAEGGAVTADGSGDRVRIDLSFPGLDLLEDLLAPREVADKLIRFSLSEQVKSGGRKPNWYR